MLSSSKTKIEARERHKDRPVTIPELTNALDQCLTILTDGGKTETMFTLPLVGLVKRAKKQAPWCPVCEGQGNDPESLRWTEPDPCPRCGGTGLE